MIETDRDDIVKRCIEDLEKIISDLIVPRNVRKSASAVKNELLDGEESLAVRAATVISKLEELINDRNIPHHTRTLVWNIVGQLELISIEE